MTRRMLIDATHPEETRVVVVNDTQLLDFDFESTTKLQIKGNIYLAKVTRVEPSLQAAFVEYGGNRHGFLAFSEIHPDYFQIPQADRAMLEELDRTENARNDAADREQEQEVVRQSASAPVDEPISDDAADDRDLDQSGDLDQNGDHEHDDQRRPEPVQVTTDPDEETADVVDEYARKRARLLRSYKIQEVIKRRQIMLVQVVKEERGNKGAALTTYLSLAGRYCVLMPNTPRGGGISRKINSAEDRRRLKDIAQEFEVPMGMGLIIRTAGQERSKAEIKRDYEYLLRQWSEIRDTTLKSIAPTLIFGEGDLIKRAMRDLYTRDIEEVLVEGDEGYRSAKRFMNMLMPSRSRRVKPYKDDDLPLFFRFKVEDQLDAMHSPRVDLPAGGSIVIHTTEALTAIDVNSGRSTRERHIDETAVKTNLEAADEIARQLRLRDLAGLVVIDFIDMGEGRHQRSVERRLRDALKLDRARLQLGRISMFGLLELSRQRLRPSLQELSSQICPVCAGLGVIRSTESCALQVLRLIQEEGIGGTTATLNVTLPPTVALYILNQKRDVLHRIEQRHQMRVFISVDDAMLATAHALERGERREAPLSPPVSRLLPPPPEVEVEEEDEPVAARPVARAPVELVANGDAERPAPAASEEGEEGGPRKRRRRRRRRRRNGDGQVATDAQGQQMDGADDDREDDGPDGGDETADAVGDEADDGGLVADVEALPFVPETVEAVEQLFEPAFPVDAEMVEAVVTAYQDAAEEVPAPVEATPVTEPAPVEPGPEIEAAVAEKPAPKPRRRRTTKPKVVADTSAAVAVEDTAAAPELPPETVAAETPAVEPSHLQPPALPEASPVVDEVVAARSEPEPQTEPVQAEADAEREPEMASTEPARPARQGWWSRLIS